MNDFEMFFSDAFGDIKQSFTAPSRLIDSLGKSLTSNPLIPIAIAGLGCLVAMKFLNR